VTREEFFDVFYNMLKERPEVEELTVSSAHILGLQRSVTPLTFSIGCI
jgi:poly(A) polymerase Pap1